MFTDSREVFSPDYTMCAEACLCSQSFQNQVHDLVAAHEHTLEGRAHAESTEDCIAAHAARVHARDELFRAFDDAWFASNFLIIT